MSKATPAHTPSRRGFLGHLLALPAAVGISPAARPENGADARLLALHRDLARHDAALRHYKATGGGSPDFLDRDAELDALLTNWWNVTRQMEATPARTAEGLRAKADALRMVLEMCALPLGGATIADIGEAEPEARFAWSLARDVLAGGVA